MDVSLPPTQESLEVPKLFHDIDGSPLVVFIDSGTSSEDKKRLQRILRVRRIHVFGLLSNKRSSPLQTSGARIQSDVNLASVLILDPHTSTGRSLIRGRYPGKVCVQSTWVQACITAGKALLRDEDYGGAKAIDDGLPLDDSDEGEGEEDGADGEDIVHSTSAAHPLPTPRPTPIVSTTGRTRRSTAEASSRRAGDRPTSSSPIASRSTSFAAGSPVASSQVPLINSCDPRSSASHSSTSMSAPMLPNPFSLPGQGLFGTQGAQTSVPVNPPSLPTSQLSISSQLHMLQQQALSHQSTSPQQSLPPHFQEIIAQAMQQQISAQQQQQLFPGLPYTPPFQSQQPMPSSLPLVQPYNPALLNGLTTFQSLAQHYNLNDPQVVETLLSIAQSRNDPVTPLLQAVRSYLPQPLVQPTASPSHQGPSGQSHTAPASSRKRKSNVYDSSSEEDEVDVRGSGNGRPASKRTPKPNKPASSSAPHSKRKGKSTSSHSSLRATEERAKLPPALKREKGQPSGATTSSKHRSQQSVKGKVFTTKKGEPLDIFVQIELRDRTEVTTAIKKNGGRITADIGTAAYCVMCTRLTTYRDLRREADTCARIVVSADFILNSVEEGKLQDPDDYSLMQAPSPKKKKGRKSTSFFTAYEKHPDVPPTPESGEEEPQRRGQSAKGKASRHSSPEPPAPVEIARGRYSFTAAENDYSWEFIRRIFDKNSWMATKNMAHRLHDKVIHRLPPTFIVLNKFPKMPHHPLSSWEQWLRKNKSTFDSIRVEYQPVSTERGQMEGDGGSKPPPSTDADADNFETHAEEQTEVEQLIEPQPGSSPESPGVASGLTSPDAYKKDFETLVSFLLVHDLDQVGDEEALWPILNKQATCITAPSWKDFLETHPDDVLNELSRRGSGEEEDIKEEE
ncbi:hypothetical protein OF83DRAFT_1167363 [Amylostereum chailletii]|nr:hypothetical protein OF83DRAFT_1167363 [Amylostereum chailletii]